MPVTGNDSYIRCRLRFSVDGQPFPDGVNGDVQAAVAHINTGPADYVSLVATRTVKINAGTHTIGVQDSKGLLVDGGYGDINCIFDVFRTTSVKLYVTRTDRSGEYLQVDVRLEVQAGPPDIQMTPTARSSTTAASMKVKGIRQAVLSGNCEYTSHALEEMDNDELTDDDVCFVLLRGEVVAALTGDSRGVRYVVRGLIDGAAVEVVCRFPPSGVLRIVTVYTLGP